MLPLEQNDASPISGLASPRAAGWSPPPRHQGPVPRSVAIVAMGRSVATYINVCAQKGDRRRVADETWAVVATGGAIQHDRLFVMDDIPNILAPCIETMSHIEGMFGWLKDHPGPIYTSKAYPEFPGTVEYPLHDVVEAVGMAYFSTTVAYAVGYAIAIGVKEIGLYGCDFTYPDNHAAESGRACCEFLIAVAMGHDIKIVIAENSTLLEVSTVANRLYGYVNPPKISLSPKD
jgi:hypothetical protein